MNKSKREINSIMFSFIFYMTIVLGIFLFGILSLYPQYKAINQEKEETLTLYSNLEGIIKNGISFQEFTTLSSQLDMNEYEKEIIKNLDNAFYEKTLKNNNFNTYLEFLDQKNKEINSLENIEARTKKEREISRILPSYSDVYESEEGGFLTDFKFVNYIEGLFDAFNLEFDDSIGITDLQIDEEFAADGKKALENSIFYIPVSLKLEGTKAGLIKFLHFSEHIGSIKLDEEENLEFYSDNVLKNEVLRLAKGKNINLYENQIFDIKLLQFNEYIDGSYQQRYKNESIIDFILRTQATDEFSMDIEMRFYIKGIQNYKLTAQIDKFEKTYNLSNQTYSKLINNANISTTTLYNAEKTLKYIKEITKDVKTLRARSQKSEDIAKVYKEAVNYSEILDSLHAKNGYHYIIVEFLNYYNSLLSTTSATLSDDKAGDAIKLKAKVLDTYFKDINERVKKLLRNTDESETYSSYYKRIATLENYEMIKEFYYNIETKK